MIISRKRFLQIAGVSVIAAAGEKLSGTFAGAMQKVSLPSKDVMKPCRWAMAIDLEACLQKEGCTKCIEACHRGHNVPEIGGAHRVEWIWKAPYDQAFPNDPSEYQYSRLKNAPVLLLCNHCDNPPCVRVCPTKATWKREDGVVMMDWHRCIGCRYCMAACPYGSRSFNWTDPRPDIANQDPDFPTRTKGVVEKCNLCEERLGRGELPLCVLACPQKAMIFGDLDDPDSTVRGALRRRYTIRRKPELGTNPQVYYIV